MSQLDLEYLSPGRAEAFVAAKEEEWRPALPNERIFTAPRLFSECSFSKQLESSISQRHADRREKVLIGSTAATGRPTIVQ